MRYWEEKLIMRLVQWICFTLPVYGHDNIEGSGNNYRITLLADDAFHANFGIKCVLLEKLRDSEVDARVNKVISDTRMKMSRGYSCVKKRFEGL